MRHCGTQLLETDRLILRRFETGDTEAITVYDDHLAIGFISCLETEVQM